MKWTKEQIKGLDKMYRTALINSLAGFRQAVLVGTKSQTGQSNLAIFNSLIHLGADPALFGLMSRPGSVPRHTLQNILDTKEYTLNYVTGADYKKAHQTSARYDADISEFKAVGFHETYLSSSTAPFVTEAIVMIAMKLEETIDIAINKTVLIIGSIVEVTINVPIVKEDGFVALSEQDTLVSQGLDAYFTAKLIGRLDYAKPGIL